MRLDVGEFMRRFLLHVLPTGFHRIRHYGLFANGHRADKLTLCRRVLDVPSQRRPIAIMMTMLRPAPTTSCLRVLVAEAA
jgi:hypothetical protein